MFCTSSVARWPRRRLAWWRLAWQRLAWWWLARRWLAWRLGLAWWMARSRLGLGRRRARVWCFPLLLWLAGRLSAGSLLSARVLFAAGLLSAGLSVCLRPPERLHAQLLRLCQSAGDLFSAANLRATAGL